MLTIDDVTGVPLFSALPATELERLARTSADVHLSAGEFAVHEGGERALFAVLTGKIEVVKTIDGIERTLGWRLPGTIFGEVPIALGTPFPGGYRASEPSRVMRVDIQQYYAVAAVSKDISLKVSALARERMGGLQSIAAEPHKPRATLVGHRWDPACGNLRRFLARNQISFNWLTPDAPELSTLWAGDRPPDNDFPVLRFADGQVVVRPEVRDIADRLGLQTSARSDEYDVAIVRWGPGWACCSGLRRI
jgi:thioredoxin reductase (NADPH)